LKLESKCKRENATCRGPSAGDIAGAGHFSSTPGRFTSTIHSLARFGYEKSPFTDAKVRKEGLFEQADEDKAG
jgi:hypothetical protein